MLLPASPLPFAVLFAVFFFFRPLSPSVFLHMNSNRCCFLLLCPFVFIVSAIPAAAQPRLHTPARLTDRFVVSTPISHSQIVYVTWSDLMFIWFILISFASSLWPTGLVVKKKYNGYSEDAEVYHWDFFFSFPCGHKIRCLPDPKQRCWVYVFVCKRLDPRFVWSAGFWRP